MNENAKYMAYWENDNCLSRWFETLAEVLNTIEREVRGGHSTWGTTFTIRDAHDNVILRYKLVGNFYVWSDPTEDETL